MYLSQNINALEQLAQKGYMIQKCVCPPSWGGVGCEVPLEECEAPNYTCRNSGMSCVLHEDEVYRCDCEDADRIGSFVGKMCRAPYTEYCRGGFDPLMTSRFCTNGGKCMSNLLVALKDSEDVPTNANFQQEGCACPKHFYGPHCEFLAWEDAHQTTRNDSFAAENTPLLIVIIVSGVSLSLAACRSVYYIRRASVRHGTFKGVMTQSDSMKFPKDDETITIHGSNNYIDAFEPTLLATPLHSASAMSLNHQWGGDLESTALGAPSQDLSVNETIITSPTTSRRVRIVRKVRKQPVADRNHLEVVGLDMPSYSYPNGDLKYPVDHVSNEQRILLEQEIRRMEHSIQLAERQKSGLSGGNVRPKPKDRKQNLDRGVMGKTIVVDNCVCPDDEQSQISNEWDALSSNTNLSAREFS